MGQTEHFEKNWKEFNDYYDIEKISKYDIARMFNGFGYSKGCLE